MRRRFPLIVVLLSACATAPAVAPSSAPLAPPEHPLAKINTTSPPDTGGDLPIPPGSNCKRMHKVRQYPCSGRAPREGEQSSWLVTACDICLSDADCVDQPGGKCLAVGSHSCGPPVHLVCRYPSPDCGGQICSEPAPRMPPSAAPR